MKKVTLITLLAILAMLFAAVGPAAAQLGQTDYSSFTVQNVDTTEATVTVYFFAEDGTQITPNPLRLDPPQSNPFTLAPGASYEVYVPLIPADQLPNGRYSVMIESSARVVTIANLIGSGDRYFNGSYSGFSESASTFYLPGVVYNYYGWYSLISVQNVGSGPADIDVTITCLDGTVGTLSAAAVPQFASTHFALKLDAPVGFTPGVTQCNGAAVITSNDNIVVTDNQSVPTQGNTQSYSGVIDGDPTVFVPALYHGYYGWNGSINIQKLGAGDTTVTATFSDGGSYSCPLLTDLAPACLMYMPLVHVGDTKFAATVTSDPPMDLMVIANAATATGAQAQTYNGVGSGSNAVGIPSVMKDYYDWNTSFTCQNISATPTSLHIVYDMHEGDAYDTAVLNEGENVEIFQPNEPFLEAGHQGGATVTANDTTANITCIVNFNNPVQLLGPGDWSMSYNAFNK